MVASSQGAPFLLNFDERSMAGMMREAKMAGCEHLIHAGNVHDYAPVGCLENTMAGNDRSGTVDCNLNLLKAVELALTGGEDLMPAVDPITGEARSDPQRRARHRRRRRVRDLGAVLERVRRADALHRAAPASISTSAPSRCARAFSPTPYLSCLVRGCAEKGLDVTQGGAELSFATIEAVTFATTVDSLLADQVPGVRQAKRCTMAELVAALRDNWEGHETLQAWAKFRAPKYGRDDDAADAMARRVMDLWTEETWKHRPRRRGGSSGRAC